MRRAFTLIELVIAMTIGAVILTAATSIAVLATEQGRATRKRSALARAGAFLHQQLSTDLRHAGLGVPTGPFHRGSLGGTPGRFNAIVLVGGDDFLGVVGDVPRPSAELPTFGSLAAIPAGPRRFTWFTDNSGVCIPRVGGGGCTMATTSRLLPGLGGCDAVGRGGDDACPWGLRRLLPGEAFTVVAGDGSWAIARMPAFAAALTPSPDGRHLVFQSASTLDSEWDDERWRNTDPAVDAPSALRGQGFVSSLDRIFYFRDGKDIRRVQCWGPPDPENAGFPSANTTTMPALEALRYAPSSGSGQVTCTPPELVAHHVDTLRFTWLDDAGAPLPTPLDAASKRLVRGVRWQVSFVDASSRLPVTEAIEGAIALRNLP